MGVPAPDKLQQVSGKLGSEHHDATRNRRGICSERKMRLPHGHNIKQLALADEFLEFHLIDSARYYLYICI